MLWTAEDANDDDLTYAVYYRGEGEKDWKLLKDTLDQKFYSWDTTSMPDGAYYLKDRRVRRAVQSPGRGAFSRTRISDRFVVDNTPPVVADIAAQPAAQAAMPRYVLSRHRCHKRRGARPVQCWTPAIGCWPPPTGELSDSLDERYSIALKGLTPGEHTVAVRVYDQFDNEAAAKATFTVPAGKR